MVTGWWSATAALAGLAAARAWPTAPRPVAADDLLPERVLVGDAVARRTLVEQAYRPLAGAGGSLLETLAAHAEHGRSLEAAEGESHLQHIRLAGVERVPSRDLGHLAQPVPHGVRVHVEHSRGRLERPPVLRVGGQGLQERAARAGQRAARSW